MSSIINCVSLNIPVRFVSSAEECLIYSSAIIYSDISYPV